MGHGKEAHAEGSVDASTAPKQRLDHLLKSLLAVQKDELQKIEGALKEIDQLKAKRKKSR